MKIGNIEVYGVIYKIKNKINDKVYIGQTVNGFKNRYCGGRWWKGTDNNHLLKSVDKYGIENFEIFEIIDIAFSRKELDIKEKVYILINKSYDTRYGYNKTMGGDGNVATVETRLKISKSLVEFFQDDEVRMKYSKLSFEKCKKYKENYRKGYSKRSINKKWKDGISRTRIERGLAKGCLNPMYGKKHSKETIKKIYDKRPNFKGDKNPFFGKKHDDTTRNKISEKKLENSKKIIVLDKEYNFILEIPYGKKASELGLAKGTEWTQCCRGRYAIHNGYRFLYKCDYNFLMENNIAMDKWKSWLREKYKKIDA